MDKTDLCFTPATELVGAIRAKKLSSVEITSTVLERIAALEPKLNGFAHLAAEEAMAAAASADSALAKGDALGPLHGIPVTIKDLEPVRGMPFERGTYLFRGDVAPADNVVVARLRDAGAIILGKTTTPEFGWKGVSHSPVTGVTHNPWKLGLNAGASSSGAGVGAAAGYGPLHQGSDGAGSIRMPAHFCGVYGLKPTYGRVPQSPMAPSDNTVHLGPLTRTVADAALMLKVMAGRHPDDQSSLEGPPADYPGQLANRPRAPRIAFSPDLGHARVDPEVADLVRKAVEAFETDLGWRVEQVETPWGPKGPELARFFWPAHYSRYADRVAEFRDRMDPGFVACIEAGSAHHAVGLSENEGRETRLLRGDPPFLRGLGFSADACRCRLRHSPPRSCNPTIGRSIRGTGCRGRSFPIRSTWRRIRRRQFPAGSPPPACRWACRSSAGAATISGCCRCRRRSRPHAHGPQVRPPIA